MSESDTEQCSNCGKVIPDDSQPLYASDDVVLTEDGVEYVEDPDGPFCGVSCHDEHRSEGLYEKYEVLKDGEPQDGCFVLKPESDANARTTLRLYADLVESDNPELADDLREWMKQIQTNSESSTMSDTTQTDDSTEHPLPAVLNAVLNKDHAEVSSGGWYARVEDGEVTIGTCESPYTKDGLVGVVAQFSADAEEARLIGDPNGPDPLEGEATDVLETLREEVKLARDRAKRGTENRNMEAARASACGEADAYQGVLERINHRLYGDGEVSG